METKTLHYTGELLWHLTVLLPETIITLSIDTITFTYEFFFQVDSLEDTDFFVVQLPEEELLKLKKKLTLSDFAGEIVKRYNAFLLESIAEGN